MITTLLVWACVVLINVIVLGLVPERRSPSSAMAWLLLILLVPVLGLLIYLLIGSPYVPRKRREEQRAVGAVIQNSLAETPALPASPDRPDWLDSAMVLNRRLGWLPGVQNNSAELFHVYEESIQAKADLIRTALPGATVRVRSPDDVHFEAQVIAAQFAGKRPLQRHQLIYGALGERMGGEIHALSIDALTPEEIATRGQPQTKET